MTNGAEITHTVRGNIARVLVDRTDRGNMLTLGMLDQLSAIVADLGRDPKINCVSLATAGPDFCLGRDPESAPEHVPHTAVEMRSALAAPIIGFYEAVRGAEVPVVATVQGRAAGFGCAAAAVCDIAIAADNALFSLPEMKNNLPPTAAISAHMDRSMPKSVAWMVYSSTPISAERAREAGFVSEVVPADELQHETDRVLETLSSRARMSLATCKTYLANARLMETDKASDYAANLLSVVMSSRAG